MKPAKEPSMPVVSKPPAKPRESRPSQSLKNPPTKIFGDWFDKAKLDAKASAPECLIYHRLRQEAEQLRK